MAQSVQVVDLNGRVVATYTPHAGEIYLTHESGNEGSDGWYPADVADVLLRTGEGWHSPNTETPAVVGGTGLDLTKGESSTPAAGGNPDGGDADTEKE